MSFTKLVRFVDADGVIGYGDLGDSKAAQPYTGEEVEVFTGDINKGLQKSGERKNIAKLLCPLPHVPHIICIGLNYRQHAEEIKLKVPNCPPLFTKPPDALAGPLDDIRIHPSLQSTLDYEGELTIIIGKDAKNVSEADAMDYILGYTCGNDLSVRYYQQPETSGNQYCFAKSFDAFAPIGPCIVSTDVIKDPQTLKLTTKVNGEVRQESNTSDMIFSVRQIIAHCSQATTLRKGMIIMTGTPGGVGWFMEPKGYLKDGDVVEVEFEGVGVLRNTMAFD